MEHTNTITPLIWREFLTAVDMIRHGQCGPDMALAYLCAMTSNPKSVRSATP